MLQWHQQPKLQKSQKKEKDKCRHASMAPHIAQFTKQPQQAATATSQKQQRQPRAHLTYQVILN